MVKRRFEGCASGGRRAHLFFSSLLLSSLELSDTKVYEPEIRARLGTAARFCEVTVLGLRTLPRLGAQLRPLPVRAPSRTSLPHFALETQESPLHPESQSTLGR